MITEKQLAEEIEQLEAAAASFENCHRLATLYVIRDNFRAQKSAGSACQCVEREPPEIGAVYVEPPAADVSSSEFLKAIQGKNAAHVWAVMDELMSTLKIINPRLYESALVKLEK